MHSLDLRPDDKKWVLVLVETVNESITHWPVNACICGLTYVLVSACMKYSAFRAKNDG